MRTPLRRLRLNGAERRLWHAFPSREWVDLRAGDAFDDPANPQWWGPERTVRAGVLAELLLSARTTPGRVPGVRLAGARVTGLLDLADAELTGELHLFRCQLDGDAWLRDATTHSVRLDACELQRINAARCSVQGVFSLDGSTVRQGVRLDDARVSGVLRMSETRLHAPERVSVGRGMASKPRHQTALPWALFAGGVAVEGGAFLRRSTIAGGIRIVGARLSGGLHLEDATIRNDEAQALLGDRLEAVAVSLAGVNAEGTVRLRGARIDGTLGFQGAHLSAPELAVHLSHARVEELFFTPESVQGGVSLAYSRFGVLYSRPHSYPSVVNLTDTVYESLRPAWSIDDHLAWVDRGPEGYRPQPYEQLATWYQRSGQDGLARRVLHARERRRRRTFHLPGRLWGHLLDGLVGYGYRPWLAGLWSALLLTAGTIAFHLVPPTQIDPSDQRVFNPFIYTLDLLVPVSVFEQRGAWDPVGGTQWLAGAIVVSGWVLVTALVAGATRTLRPSD